MNEEKRNPKLKDFTDDELIVELMNRNTAAVFASGKTIQIKSGAPLLTLAGLCARAERKILITLDNIEAKKAKGGIIVPKFN